MSPSAKNTAQTSEAWSPVRRLVGLGLVVISLAAPGLRAGAPAQRPLEIDTTLTIRQIARRNQVPAERLLKSLDLQSGQEFYRPSQAGCTVRQLENAIINARSLEANQASGSWFFALAKFAKWALKLIAKVLFES